jgi:sec-independent protein translocase protein TatA
MGEFGPWHLLIVAGVFVLLFGAKRLPEAARSLGKSARIMKTELHSLHDETPAPIAAPVAVPATVPVAATHDAL